MELMIKIIKEYFADVSRSMLRHIPEEHSADEVLFIGSFSAMTERRIQNRFPKGQITHVDDPLGLIDDSRTYDVILLNVHLEHIRFSAQDKEHIAKRMSSLLARDGYLAMRASRASVDSIRIFDGLLSRWERWSSFGNHFLLYRHFGRGRVGDPVPEGYVDRQQSHLNLSSCTGSSKLYAIVGEPGRIGLRTSFGPFVSEDYFTEEEPIIEPHPFPRTIKWQPMTISEKAGWKRHPFPGDIYQKGLGVIREDNCDSYWKEWSAHAQRHRNKWLRDDRYEMNDVSLDEFARAYHASKKLDWLTRTGFVRVLQFHEKHHPQALRLFGARDKQTGEIVAGLALLQLDDIKQSFHTVSFICDSVRQTSVGVGLIDHWYKRGIEEDVRFFNYGIVWREGDPGAWKGYSKFKRQFNLYLVCYPKPLMKFLWGGKV